MLGFNLEHKKPTIKQLQKFVIKKVTSKYYELGIELYKDSDVDHLDAIKKASATDLTSGCTDMFKFWLQTYENATWDKLIRALRASGLQQNTIALNIMKEVVEG